jgi:hypothetical protein
MADKILETIEALTKAGLIDRVSEITADGVTISLAAPPNYISEPEPLSDSDILRQLEEDMFFSHSGGNNKNGVS